VKGLPSAGAWVFLGGLLLAFVIGRYGEPVWQVEVLEQAVSEGAQGRAAISVRGEARPVTLTTPEDSLLWDYREGMHDALPTHEPEFVRILPGEDGTARVFKLVPRSHRAAWSLLPTALAIILCFATRQPVIALLGGILAGALLIGEYDITGAVLVENLGTTRAATILVLYLWLLGGLLGIWSANGAARAFATWVTRQFVRGPRSAKFAAWLLGLAFHQGGTMSTVLVGTTARPIADRERVSHEELAYVVDSTASPIAVLIPFNAWPLYVAGFIYVAGVPFLETEAQRLDFFFGAIPYAFYALFAVLFTLLLSLDRLPLISRRFKEAIARARETGKLDHPQARPLAARELETAGNNPPGRAHVLEFLVPLLLLIGIAVFTRELLWGFAAALSVAALTSLLRGMSLAALMDGFAEGLKGVVIGSVVLLLAVVLGEVTGETGGGFYLVELLGERVPFWALPVALQLMTMLIAFATGTSWGTYAVTFPLAMPLAWAVTQNAGLADPELFMTLCFAAVINGSVYGDQCSPISDTTVLSSMATGCDLMDHVRTQFVPCSFAALLASIGWTVCTFFAA